MTADNNLVHVGERECVTCTRCATTFAAVHPACPYCSADRRRNNEIERLRDALRDTDWLMICYRDIVRGNRVRGLGEAIAAYESSHAALAAAQQPPAEEPWVGCCKTPGYCQMNGPCDRMECAGAPGEEQA